MILSCFIYCIGCGLSKDLCMYVYDSDRLSDGHYEWTHACTVSQLVHSVYGPSTAVLAHLVHEALDYTHEAWQLSSSRTGVFVYDRLPCARIDNTRYYCMSLSQSTVTSWRTTLLYNVRRPMCVNNALRHHWMFSRLRRPLNDSRLPRPYRATTATVAFTGHCLTNTVPFPTRPSTDWPAPSL